MVRLFFRLLLVFWLLPVNSLGQSKDDNKTVIVIDPGHGGTDSGAIGVNGIREKDMVLNIGKEMARINEVLFGESFEIYLTRNTDTMISLGDRAALAKKLNADLFVSLHGNHSKNTNIKGVEVYVPRKGKHLQCSIIFAYQLQKGLRQNIGFKSRGVKFANLQVLKETVDNCPSVLVELGFLTNRDESSFLSKDENILALALSLLSALQIKNWYYESIIFTNSTQHNGDSQKHRFGDFRLSKKIEMIFFPLTLTSGSYRYSRMFIMRRFKQRID